MCSSRHCTFQTVLSILDPSISGLSISDVNKMPNDRLRSVSRILNHLQNESTWATFRRFRALLDHWPDVVGEIVARQTRPISLRGETLYVATASAAWAQTLVFERTQILNKLNAVLSSPIQEIRFSTAHWAAQADELDQDSAQGVWVYHPSRVDRAESQGAIANARVWPDPDLGSRRATEPKRSEIRDDSDRCARKETPVETFERWAEKVKLRSCALPSCPRCRCPTPIGELQRWQVCALCHALQIDPSV